MWGCKILYNNLSMEEIYLLIKTQYQRTVSLLNGSFIILPYLHVGLLIYIHYLHGLDLLDKHDCKQASHIFHTLRGSLHELPVKSDYKINKLFIYYTCSIDLKSMCTNLLIIYLHEQFKSLFTENYF